VYLGALPAIAAVRRVQLPVQVAQLMGMPNGWDDGRVDQCDVTVNRMGGENTRFFKHVQSYRSCMSRIFASDRRWKNSHDDCRNIYGLILSGVDIGIL
jgi:hypothetical protein